MDSFKDIDIVPVKKKFTASKDFQLIGCLASIPNDLRETWVVSCMIAVLGGNYDNKNVDLVDRALTDEVTKEATDMMNKRTPELKSKGNAAIMCTGLLGLTHGIKNYSSQNVSAFYKRCESMLILVGAQNLLGVDMFSKIYNNNLLVATEIAKNTEFILNMVKLSLDTTGFSKSAKAAADQVAMVISGYGMKSYSLMYDFCTTSRSLAFLNKTVRDQAIKYVSEYSAIKDDKDFAYLSIHADKRLAKLAHRAYPDLYICAHTWGVKGGKVTQNFALTTNLTLNGSMTIDTLKEAACKKIGKAKDVLSAQDYHDLEILGIQVERRKSTKTPEEIKFDKEYQERLIKLNKLKLAAAEEKLNTTDGLSDFEKEKQILKLMQAQRNQLKRKREEDDEPGQKKRGERAEEIPDDLDLDDDMDDSAVGF